MTEATKQYILNISYEREGVENILSKQIREERILAQISELERARGIIQSKYYYSRIETLCKEYEKLKKNNS